jgi:hypothetical protein
MKCGKSGMSMKGMKGMKSYGKASSGKAPKSGMKKTTARRK